VPGDGDAVFESYFDGDAIRFARSARAGVDEQRARALAVRALQDALPPGIRQGRLDRLTPMNGGTSFRITVRGDARGVGGGTLGASDAYLPSVRDVFEALVTHAPDDVTELAFWGDAARN
jgi:hypothetical protein